MNRRTVALALLLALPGPLACSEESTTAAETVIPISGYWINAEDPPTPDPGCVMYFTTSQTGEADYVGPFTGTGATCIANPPSQLAEAPHFFYDPAPPYFVAEFENEMVWTTSDGDELWLRPNQGVFVQSLTTGQVSVLGDLRVDGGTGRFEGATGELAVRSATEDGTRIDFEGTLTVTGQR